MTGQIKLSDVAPEPLNFDYWIVLVEGQDSNEPSSNVPEPRCGDGIVQPGEACDDGNNVDGDGCSATCGVEEISQPTPEPEPTPEPTPSEPAIPG